MICKKCGSENQADVQFCSTCGSPIEVDVATSGKSRKNKWMIIGIAAAVLLVLGTLGYVFRWQIARVVAPKKYLQMSVEKTMSLMSKENEEALNWENFEGVPVSHEFSISSTDANASLDGVFMFDAEAEKALLDVSMEMDGQEYNDNQVYISQALCAFSFPSVMTDVDFLTLTPKTFSEDWDAYFEGEEENPIPDMEAQIHAFFAGTATEEQTTLQNDISQRMKETNEKAKFQDLGTSQQDVMGKNYSLKEMTYTYSDSEVNALYEDILDLIRDSSLLAAQEDMYEMYGVSSSDMSDELDAMFDEMRIIECEEDIVVHFFVDQDGIVRKITIDEFEVSIDGTDFSMEFDVALGGGSKSPSSDMEMNLTFAVEGEELEIQLVKESANDKGIYSSSLEIDMSTGGTDLLTMQAEYTWDKEQTIGKNLEASFTVGYVHDFVQFKRDQQDGFAGVSLRDQLRMNVFDRSDVQSARRLNRNKEIRILVDFACKDRFLLIAAGHASDDGIRALPGPHIVLLYQRICIFPDCIFFDKSELLEFRFPIPLQNHVLCKRIIQYETIFMAVFRNMADSSL